MSLTSKLVLLIAFGSLFSCTSYEITPGSERVRVFDAEPKNCLYIGEVSSIQKGRTIGTLETYMDLGTRIDLRNKAHELGGNVLVFLKGKQSGTLPGTTIPKKPAPVSTNQYSEVKPIQKDEKGFVIENTKSPVTTEPPDEPT